MALTDIVLPLTAKKNGPAGAPMVRPKVFYLKSTELFRINYDSVRNSTVIRVKDPKRKIELYESPDEFMGMQALSQGATASQVFTKVYAALTPTSSATGADAVTAAAVPTKYYNEISAVGTVGYVRLPDPFVKRLFVLQNLTGTAVSVNGRGTTSPINGSTAAYTLAAYKRIHFLAPTASTAGTTAGWQTAVDA